jgi:hypothetical protein
MVINLSIYENELILWELSFIWMKTLSDNYMELELSWIEFKFNPIEFKC